MDLVTCLRQVVLSRWRQTGALKRADEPISRIVTLRLLANGETEISKHCNVQKRIRQREGLH